MAAGYDGSIRIDTKIDSKGFNTGVGSIGKGLTRITSSLRGVAVAAGIAFGVKALVEFGKSSVKAITELTNAMTGLKSIMDGQGRSFKNAQKFINEYVSDGLIPATNAITAYKNLASRGYSDGQIEQVLIALKDSAAFGRQASYNLGDAVMTATEGLKNENSILVDNAGVTKNVAKMWEDYAKSIGTTTNKLTKQQKIQAEVTGILEETKFQTGDAAKIANSYSGEVLKLGFNFNNLKIAVGNALLPIAWAILPSINAIIAALTRLANVFAQVTTAIFGRQAQQQEQVAKTGISAAKAQDKLANATKKVGKEAKKATAPFDDLNVLAEDTADAALSAADGLDNDLGLGDIATGGEIGAGVTVSSDVQTAIDKIFRMLEPLKSLNFDNLNNAFDRLKKAVEPITQSIFAGLEWAYLNLFVPLAKWTIEDVLPAFITALAAAMNVLNSAIFALKPLFVWLWDKFLKPIAEWTGGVIIQVLYDIADALNGVAEWIKNNQGIVQKVALISGGIVVAIYAVINAFKLFSSISSIMVSVKTFIVGAMAAIKIALTSINPVIVLVIAGIALVVAAIIDLWQKSEDFRDNIKGVVEQIGEILRIVWETTIKPVFDTFMQTVDWLWEKHLQPLLNNFYGLVQDFVLFAAEIINKCILPIVRVLANVFGPTIALVFQNAIDVLGTFLATATDIINGVITIIRGIIEFLTGVFTGDWKKAWEGIVKIFKGIFEGIGGIIKGVVNTAIDMINSMIRAITTGLNFIIKAMNKLSFDIPDWVPAPFGGKSWGFNIPTLSATTIPKLATGAVIPPNSEFLAILGDQKSGRNIETPESLLRQILREELSNLMAGGDTNLNLTLQIGDDTITERIINNINRQSRISGKTVITI